MLAAHRRSIDERAVLEVLLKAARVASQGWLQFNSCQCLVSKGGGGVGACN